MGDQGPIFFFRESDPQWGFLSQWYPSPFSDTISPSSENKPKTKSITHTYQHAEQYMMHHKALHFSDHATATEVLLRSSPRKCKGLCRAVKNFDPEKWDKVKLAVVEEGSYLKFTRCETRCEVTGKSLKERLLETGDRELVEASHFDRVWGVGFSPDQCRQMLKNGEGRGRWGQNLLGRALMAARRRIREEEERAAVVGVEVNQE